MNRTLLQQYVGEYERDFYKISDNEIYKWRAVKRFQDNWNVEAEDFAIMLEISLKKTSNLMASGNYYPRRVIVKIAERNPMAVRAGFIDLFNEDRDLLERIRSFQAQISELNSREFGQKRHFQDDRAVMVYLTLQYPETYYLYKFTMFKTFAEKLEDEYIPKVGSLENTIHFLNICNQVREELISNNQILKLHSERIGEQEYFDGDFHLLTQDFIYAVTKYLNLSVRPRSDPRPRLTFTNLQPHPLEKTYHFEGHYIDHVAQQKRNKRVGDAGEELVLAIEKDKYGDGVEHSSKTKGDGLGFDILSFDDTRNRKYIEVKTTKGDVHTPFFISGAELEKSKQEGSKYCLYRLYNFDEQAMTADCLILRGDLSLYCNNPIQFEVIFKASTISP